MRTDSVSGEDWRRMAELLGDAAEADSRHAMMERVIQHAHALWEAELVIHDILDEQGRQIAYQMFPAPTPFIASLQPAFVELWHQHPFAENWTESIGSGRVNFLSDRISNREFRQTGLWNEVYIHLRSKHQVMMGGPIEPGRYWCLVMNRLGRDFGPRERELGRFLQPRLTRLFQQRAHREKAESPARLVADTATPYLLLDRKGHILTLSDNARRLFAESRTPFPPQNLLPGMQRIWDATLPAGTLVRQTFGGVDAVATAASDLRPALVLLGRAATEAPATAQQNRLTPREAEILHWIGEGKRNAEIAMLLGISERTVGKHCERIFQKLGVENRLNAALMSRRVN